MKIRKTIFLILIILNCITIFYFSNQVANTSSASSGRVVNFVMKVVPMLKNMEESEKEHIANEVLQPIVRKLAHFSIYALLGFLIMNYAITHKEQNIAILHSWILGTLYAISDEIHQLFIQGRSCELRDVCIDSLGVLTGIICALMIVKIYNKIKKVKSNEKISS